MEAEFLAKDLKRAMIMTGCNSLADISDRIFA
jgi:isopentenyl diphosphate isomerase/L-lactate dehydrogenase-like FMN-dependent dehydrogenase